VSKVVLYQNGIGYFERYGTVEGEELRLRVRPDQINDMLSSLTVIDTKGGVASISLPVEPSASMMMGELPPQVRNAGGMMSILEAFRGAKVKISGDNTATGRIVGIERVNEAYRVTLLTDSSDLVPIDVDKIKRVELEDRTLTVGLDKALDATLGDGDWKPIELTVRFPKGGTHEVLMSYVVAMPTWKPAYRLVIGENGKARLQGWAVVDNVSGEDWNDVRLSLTAGAPISFIVDLHSPRLPGRPDLTARTYSSYSEAPPEAIAAWSDPKPVAQPRASSSERSKPKAKKDYAKESYAEESAAYDDFGAYDYDGDYSGAYAAPSFDDGLMMNSIEASSEGEQLGALFRYDIKVPVTVPDRSSALVAIVNADVDGEDILLFDPSSGSARASSHPYRAVRLTNSTDFVLEQGPLTIYKSSTFVGSGLSAQIGKGQTVFVPYSLEPGIHVEQFDNWGEQEQRLVKIKDGIMTVDAYQLYRSDFTITNHQEENGVLYLRVNKRAGFEMKESPEVIVQGDVYFVRAEAAAGQVQKTSAVQTSRSTRTLSLFDYGAMDAIALYVTDVNADPKVKGQLESVVAIQTQIGDIEHRRQALAERQGELRARAQDLRSNITVLARSTSNAQLKDELSKKLADVDAELSKIDRELVELGESKYGLEVQMRELFNGIELSSN
jgi:hypothetical protein